MRRVVLAMIGLLGAWTLRLLMATVRIRTEGMERVDRIHERGEQAIFAFWHGWLLLPLYSERHRKIHVMASLSRDGDIAAHVLRRFGFRAVRGSTSRRGARAVIEMARAARAGFDTAVTPDGPRGPRYRVQGGVLALARLTGFPIVPAGLGCSRCRRLHSWDEFRIPHPFSTGAIVLGEPLYVRGKHEEGEEKEVRARLEGRIAEASARAEALACGGRGVGPGGRGSWRTASSSSI